METSTTVTRQRATHYIVGKLQDEHIKIIYFKDWNKSFRNYLQINNIECPHESLVLPSPADNPKDCLSILKENLPYSFSVFTNKSGKIYKSNEILNGTKPPLQLLRNRGKVYLIKNISIQQRCENCGVIYTSKHECNQRRRDYYHHIINHETKSWWEVMKFTPVGSEKSTQRLFIVYDIETYTYHSQYGKQLTPYLLVFKVIGNKKLKKIAKEIAAKNFIKQDKCFFIMDPTADVIGIKFKNFRLAIQKKIADVVWQKFAQDNNLLDKEYTFKELELLNKQHLLNDSSYPQWVEIIVIGHNIASFDEIVLASHVLEGITDKKDFIMYNIKRNFLPRAGKLLFNDLTFSLPNPTYKKPDTNTYKRWQTGNITSQDLKWQGIKFMVRDTYLLTHCSLRNAATAYQLPVVKGYCPYTALNEFFMTGKYEMELNKYPAKKYWQSEEEYLQNKTNNEYDIIKESIKYCIDDVKVTAELVKKLAAGYQIFAEKSLNLDCYFNIFQRPTISSNTQALFKQLHFKNENGLSFFLPQIKAPSSKMYDHIRQSIRGGRCYPTFLGHFKDPIYVYDICGMYASALTHPMPYGETLEPFAANMAIDNLQYKLKKKEKISYFDENIKPMIVAVDCEPPDSEFLDVLPPICSKKSGKLCWTNEPMNGEILTTIDIITLHNRGWKCKILKNHPIYAVWPSWKTICKDYVRVNIEAKEKADKEKNQTQRSISKLLSNALYGSFATKIENKKTVFVAEMEENDIKNINSGKSEIVNYTTVINTSLPKRNTDKWHNFLSSLPDIDDYKSESTNEKITKIKNISHDESHVTFKPITHLEATCDNLVLANIKETTEWIQNKRYPTQIASFVLAWTRAFMSEWSEFLYGEDMGVPIYNRTPKSIYGDTDSLFLTEKGHQLMLLKGSKRLKKNGGKMVFDENAPDLAWLVECETICNVCGTESYANESCYLAPKIYALKNIVCPKCNNVQEGKLRAKGHAKECLSYEMLKKCFYEYFVFDEPKNEFYTEKTSIKRTLETGNSKTAPFTVLEKRLKRILRPWQEKTMNVGTQLETGFWLYPYDKSHPNPRYQSHLIENPFWESM